MESMLIQKPVIYTEEDYYNLPEGFRSELIDGQIYVLAPPSRKHKDILMELAGSIRVSNPKTAPVRSIQPHLLSN